MKSLRLYHYSAEDGAAFGKALTDYLESSGRSGLAAACQKEPAVFRRGEHGKPYFFGHGLEDVFFSRSDTRGHAIVCFSDAEIGLDCENTRARPGIETRAGAIAKRCFTENERAYLDSDSHGAARRFFEIWTAKEAYMKYTGRGFSEGFRTFSVFDLPCVRIETGLLPDAPHVVYSVCTGDAGENVEVVHHSELTGGEYGAKNE